MKKLSLVVSITSGKTTLTPEDRHYHYFNNALCVFVDASSSGIKPGSNYTVEVDGSRSELIRQEGELRLFNVGNELAEGRWSSDDLVFVVANIHYAQVLHGLLRYTPQPKFSDLVANYGLQDYTGFIELRRGGASFQQFQFRSLDATVIPGGQAEIRCELAEPLRDKPIFMWKVLAFSGRVDRLCMLDCTLRDESSEIFWWVSKLACIKRAKLVDYSGQNYELTARNSTGALTLVLSDREGSWFINEAVLRLSLAHINRWFSTAYK